MANTLEEYAKRKMEGAVDVPQTIEAPFSDNGLHGQIAGVRVLSQGSIEAEPSFHAPEKEELHLRPHARRPIQYWKDRRAEINYAEEEAKKDGKSKEEIKALKKELKADLRDERQAEKAVAREAREKWDEMHRGPIEGRREDRAARKFLEEMAQESGVSEDQIREFGKGLSADQKAERRMERLEQAADRPNRLDSRIILAHADHKHEARERAFNEAHGNDPHKVRADNREFRQDLRRSAKDAQLEWSDNFRAGYRQARDEAREEARQQAGYQRGQHLDRADINRATGLDETLENVRAGIDPTAEALLAGGKSKLRGTKGRD